MITEQDLQEAIAECQGVRNPNASTCMKLAAFLIIQKEMYGKKDEGLAQVYASVPTRGYSYDDDSPRGSVIEYESDTEFSNVVSGMNQEDVMSVMDELMETLQVVQPRIYASVLRKLKEKY